MSERPSAHEQKRRRRTQKLNNDKPWPSHLRLGDKLQRLALLAPLKLRALETLIDDTLADVWRNL